MELSLTFNISLKSGRLVLWHHNPWNPYPFNLKQGIPAMQVLLDVLLQFLMLVASLNKPTRKRLRSSAIVSNLFENSLMYQYLSEAI